MTVDVRKNRFELFVVVLSHGKLYSCLTTPRGFSCKQKRSWWNVVGAAAELDTFPRLKSGFPEAYTKRAELEENCELFFYKGRYFGGIPISLKARSRQFIREYTMQLKV